MRAITPKERFCEALLVPRDPLGHDDIRLAEAVRVWHHAGDDEPQLLIELVGVALQIPDAREM